MNPLLRLPSFLILIVATLLGSATAQQPQPDASGQQDDTITFKTNVDVVSIFFNVKDKRGALIPELKKEDFQVFEDGKPQTIKYFSREADQPLTLGMLIDTSVSQTRVLPIEQQVGSEFLKQFLRPKDMAFVIDFNTDVNLVQDYTNSDQYLRSSLKKVKINSCNPGGMIPGVGGGPVPQNNPRCTVLYDAIFLAADEKLKSEVGRKAMIILTDGTDQGSRLNIHQAIEAAQKSDAIVYVLMIADRAEYPAGDSEMKKLSQETGGRVIEVGDNEEKLRKAMQQISDELRTQYMIGYTPTNTKRDASYRKLEIKPTNKDLKIQARKGYFAPSDQ